MIMADLGFRQLGNVLSLVDSGTWGDEATPDTGSPVLRSTNIDIDSYRMVLDDPAWRVIPANDRERRKLHTNDIIVTKSSGSPDHIGKCAVFHDPEDGHDYYFSNFMLRLRADDSALDFRWLQYWLTSDRGRFELQRLNSTTTGLRNLIVDQYLAQKIPLPPLSEQKRIADILDKADTIRRKRQEAIQLLDEVARSDFLDTAGDPFANSKGFPTRTLDKVFDIRTGKLDANAAVEGGEYPFFTCSRENYAIDVFAFDCEALILSGNNASADYSVKQYKGKFNAYQRTYVLGLKKQSHSYSFFRQLLEYKLNEMKHGSRGTNTKYLTLEFFKRFELPVPPKDVQDHFEQVGKQQAKTETRLSAAVREADNLFNSLVQRAFLGEV